ncbi:RNA polymerase II subunit A C-terminal domain phosphatase Ssu72p [[Candida] jaroonii]|uniref:RNA polymerase II subunit A C-terminal domain phosphatase Ssu72p n=1 Tax=[Candida] jaroonii TaxID=467808 RepID=A0ACA9YBW5_9ASCO|nr:RNA polymerase II subunit A C-terminal domain phosphatase Ssu72p [[Candida] jaroonii]
MSETIVKSEVKVPDSLKICTVCAANNNRSMEAHRQLRDAGYNINSFGTGNSVRLPGPSVDKPNVYEFGTPYEEILNDLMSQNNRKTYEANGLLHMLNRNRQVKTAPEKWHLNSYAGKFDLVITCEERCFDSVVDDLMYRLGKGQSENEVSKIVHVINIDIKDDNENAIIGGNGIVELVNMIHEFRRNNKKEVDDPSENILEDQMMKILTEWQKNHSHLQTIYTVAYY